jgi:Type II secretion system (T2SS), protein M subtype b
MMAITSLIPRGKDAWTLAGGVVGIVILGVIILMGPVKNRFHNLEEEISIQETRLNRNLAIVAPTAREAVEKEFKRYGEVIRKRGSSDEENSQMMSEIDKLAGLNKVILSATKPRDTKKEKDYEAYGVEVEIEADMTALMGFLYSVESSSQLLRVDRLVIESKGAKDPSALHGTLAISKVVTL